MVIAVFDSGLGSLSIIKSIRKFTKSDIVYFADQKHFPYGKKTKPELKRIIDNAIIKLEENFHPDVIVMASNTPSILFPNYLDSKIFGVIPPLKKASILSKTKKIGIMTTSSVIQSKELTKYIEKIIPNMQVEKINATKLVELVESGKFLTNKKYCSKIVQTVLEKQLNEVDVVTLSSTHLPFLLPILKREFPTVQFLDPADDAAKQIAKKIKRESKNQLKIYTSKDPKTLQKHLQKMGIKNKVRLLS